MDPRRAYGLTKRVFQAVATICLLATDAPALPVESLPPGFPDASSSGVAPGVELSFHDGNLVIDKVGAIVNGLDIRGTVTINASDVTLSNCRVTSASIYVVNVASSAKGVTVQNCTIDGVGTGNDGSAGISGSGTFLNNNIYNVENGLSVGSNSVIRDNYVHDLLASGAPHYDGIQIDGNVSNVVIDHNTIVNSHIQTSAVMIDNWAGAISNIVVSNNLLIGGGYTVYSDGQFRDDAITGVVFANNRLRKGHFGYRSFVRNTPAWVGNVEARTGVPLR